MSLVEDEVMPTVKQYLNSIPTLIRNGTTRLPKPIGADTKVQFAKPCPLQILHAVCKAEYVQRFVLHVFFVLPVLCLHKTGNATWPPKLTGPDTEV